MKATVTARLPAARAVAAVAARGVNLDVALNEALTGAASGAAAIRSLTYGAVRGYFRHEALLDRLLGRPAARLDPLVRALLSVALYELEDRRSPDYAIVAAAVDAARAGAVGRAAGLVNAVLRRYLRDRDRFDAWLGRTVARRHAAPPWLAARVRADWPDRWESMLAALDAQAPMWLRVDARRSTAEQYIACLREAGLGARGDVCVPYAVRLDQPREVRALPGFAEGLVSVQDLGAQCVAYPLALRPGQRVLDACAAPGGKAALIAEREPALAHLLALDVDPTRLERVRENLRRGALSAEVACGDATEPATWWSGERFDRILVDAPCSGLGVIRRHPDIRLRKSAADLDRLPPLQARLLRALWPLLAPGGRLVYATCTFTAAENRAVIADFVRASDGAESVPAGAWPGWPGFGVADAYGVQILPGEAGADGFYYAAVNKR
ncbi:MAG TPA: 16S rRNA (cytosine(967)-C(5))-methyltransferase RsmB [Steroidobacteraceae bacterium]|nr:16S rRNA (cytosine(967)-C(5))-methyltransferase RsmB [Steroidobacteraceae bacterium]